MEKFHDKEKKVKEAMDLKAKLHSKFSQLLNSGKYTNNQKLSLSGISVKIDMRLVSDVGSKSLSTTDLANKNTKYYMKISVSEGNNSPFRIEIDNIHSMAHLNNPVTNDRVDIPVKNVQNMGYCGSVAFGLTMRDDDLKNELLNYF